MKKLIGELSYYIVFGCRKYLKSMLENQKSLEVRRRIYATYTDYNGNPSLPTFIITLYVLLQRTCLILSNPRSPKKTKM